MENCSSWLAVVALVDSEAWLQRFADHMRVGRRSENTISSYRVTVKQFLRFLAVERGLESPHQIQAADIEAYQVSLERQLSFKGTPLTLATKNGKVSVVRAFVKFLRRTNVLMTDPVKDIVCPRQPRTILPELPTEEQVQRLLEAPASEPNFSPNSGFMAQIKQKCPARKKAIFDPLTQASCPSYTTTSEKYDFLGTSRPLAKPEKIWTSRMDCFKSSIMPGLEWKVFRYNSLNLHHNGVY